MIPYHRPVLLQECIEGLNIREGGTYVDATFGGGGHTAEILKRIGKGRVIALDQDEDAERNVQDDVRLQFLQQNFRHLKNCLRFCNALPVNGILADLGVSWHQFDRPERGFSYRFEGALDMRMNKSASLTAMEVVNGYGKEDLTRLLRDYGEIRHAARVADELIRVRKNRKIHTAEDLKEATGKWAERRKEKQYYAQIFQAIRIEVNDELGALKELLRQAEEVLEKTGRLVVISYHSLEDRMVKNYMRTANYEGKEEKDLYGNIIRPFRPVNRKVIVPEWREIQENPRSRSARLRIAEKI